MGCYKMKKDNYRYNEGSRTSRNGTLRGDFKPELPAPPIRGRKTGKEIDKKCSLIIRNDIKENSYSMIHTRRY